MKSFFYLMLLVSSFTALGEDTSANGFLLEGKLVVTDPYKRVHEKNMPLGFSNEGNIQKFIIGENQFKVPGKPEKYSIAILLQDNNFVWVQEFHSKPIKSFVWQLGEHKISLVKEILRKPVKGDYILSIDDKDYFFNNRLAQVTFIFNDEGIESFDVSGMVASLGLNRAKNECKQSSGQEESNAGEGEAETDKDTEETNCKPPES
ncbi:hypothetical protein N9L48_07385 [Psychrosphaera sp.]|nr:hypothetical protein [Psychrosphaera sp.]